MTNRRHWLAGAAILFWGSAMAATATRPQRATAPPPVPLMAPTRTPNQAGARAARVSYETQIRPLIVENCLECHSSEKRKGGLSLATYADALEGGKDGPIVRPGHG